MRAAQVTALLLCSTSVASSHALPKKRSALEPYAPFTTSCPPGSLVRRANGINSKEAEYVEQRSKKADEALLDWLGQAWDCAPAELRDLPKIAIALSGGGPKAGLTTAGAVYAFDARDSNSSVAGILQASTYISALSGGTLTLAGVMSNNFELISTLKKDFYDQTYQNTFAPALPYISNIGRDVSNKTAAGYTSTLLDIYGRIISFSFFAEPPEGGNGLLFSDIIKQSSFTNHEAPFPLYTVTNSDVAAGQCSANASSATWELSPLEFGSWDATVDSFYPTEYIGTKSNSPSGSCTAGFDNTGFFTGISSNILISANHCSTGNYSTSALNSLALPIYQTFPADRLINPYGIIPNPFYQNPGAGAIQSQQNLYLADGGFTGQVIPIFPFIQNERNVDVVILVDTESNGPMNITSGATLYATYASAQANGLSKMPLVPTLQQFTAQNLTAHPSFFGCYEEDKTTLVYLPNTDETIMSGFSYTPAQVQFVFQGGYELATANNDTEWAGCLACAIMHKSPWELPESCDGCLDKYCWRP